MIGVVAEEAVLGEAVMARGEGKGGEEGGVVREVGAEGAATSLPLLAWNSWMQTWTPISRSVSASCCVGSSIYHTKVHSRSVVVEVDSRTNVSLDCKCFMCLW